MSYTKRLIESVFQTTRSGTSGYQDDEDVNRNIAMAENEVMETLAPWYSANQKVQDMLAPFVNGPTPSPVTSGSVSIPSNYVQLVDAVVDGKPVWKKNVNEISLIRSSATRKPKSAEDGPYYIWMSGNAFKVLPEDLSSIDLIYIRRPVPGEISYSYVSTDDTDMIELSVINETEWPERAFNLLYYHLLEKYGVDQTEQLSMEYSQLGIQREISKI